MRQPCTTSAFRVCNCAAACRCEAGAQGCLCRVADERKTEPESIAAGGARGVWSRLAEALAAVSLLTACVHGQSEPANMDLSTARWSEHGTYRVSYASETHPIPVNRLHRWTLHVESKSGRPVTDAAVQVDGDMPEHGHGLPTRPRVTRNLGNGDYLVEGMKFQMGGWWLVEFTVAAADGSDVAKFNLRLPK